MLDLSAMPFAEALAWIQAEGGDAWKASPSSSRAATVFVANVGTQSALVATAGEEADESALARVINLLRERIEGARGNP